MRRILQELLGHAVRALPPPPADPQQANQMAQLTQEIAELRRRQAEFSERAERLQSENLKLRENLEKLQQLVEELHGKIKTLECQVVIPGVPAMEAVEESAPPSPGFFKPTFR